MKTLSRLISIDSNVAHPVLGTDVDTGQRDRSKRKVSANSTKTLAVAIIMLMAALAHPGVAQEFTLHIPTSIARNTDFLGMASVQPPTGGKPVVNSDGLLIGWVIKDPLGDTWLVPRVPAGVMTSPPQRVTVYEGGGVFLGELLVGTLTDPALEKNDSELNFYRRWLSEVEELILVRENILQDPYAGQETKKTARAQLADLYEEHAYVENRLKEEESLRRAEERESQELIETTDEAQVDVSEAFADDIKARPGDTLRTDDGVYPRAGNLDEKAESPSEKMAYDIDDDEISDEDPELGDEEPVLSREEIVERIFSELYGQEGLRLLNAMKRQGGTLIIEDLILRQWDVWQESGTVINHVSIDEALSDIEAAELLFKLLLEHPELYNWTLDLTADDLQRLHQRMVKLAAELTSTAFNLGYSMAAGFGGTIVFVANDIETGNLSVGTLMSLLPYLPKGMNMVKILGKNGQVLVKAPGCFVAGTKVLTDNGFKNIEDIRVGDNVWSRNEQTGKYAYKMVTRLFRGHTDRLVHLTYARLQESSPHRTESHGPGAKRERKSAGEAWAAMSDADTQTLRSTLEHPYWVRGRGWVQAIDIRVDDRLLGSRDEELIVVDHEVRQQEADHYNLEVEGWHSFFVAQREGQVAYGCTTTVG